MPEAKYITPKQIGAAMEIPYREVLLLLKLGALSASKEKGKWKIPSTEFDNFKARNTRRIKALQETYVGLYWQGVSHYQFQKRVPDDFQKNHIVAPIKGFAETTIYNALKEGKQVDSR